MSDINTIISEVNAVESLRSQVAAAVAAMEAARQAHDAVVVQYNTAIDVLVNDIVATYTKV